MSKEAAARFIDHLAKDKGLRQKLHSASEGALRTAKENGYDFTWGELRETLKEKWGIKKDCWEEDALFCCLSETPRF
jgi:predicted ribosomally synthesized peptide with nif11-like leader